MTFAIPMPIDDAHVLVLLGGLTQHRIVVVLLPRVWHTDGDEVCRLAAGQVNELLHFLLIRNHAVRAEAKHHHTATVAGSGVLLIHIHRLRQLTVRQAIDKSVRECGLDGVRSTRRH